MTPPVVRLRTAVVIDYQNVHLTGHELFDSTRHLPRHETLVDPLMFSRQLIDARNGAQRPGHPPAVLSRVLVFRGLPSDDHDPAGYARNQAQKSAWERDRRVSVTLRPLKYRYQRDATGAFAHDVRGDRIVVGRPEEKGVDVLCALAVVSQSQQPEVDLVILASSDSDLAPCLDEARRLGQAKIETFCWFDRVTNRGYQLHPTDRTRPLWNTRLYEQEFRASWDPNDYA